jgi:hypothetical protein
MRPEAPPQFMPFRRERRTKPSGKIAIAASRTKLAELLGSGEIRMAARAHGLASSLLSNFRVPEAGQPHYGSGTSQGYFCVNVDGELLAQAVAIGKNLGIRTVKRHICLR